MIRKIISLKRQLRKVWLRVNKIKLSLFPLRITDKKLLKIFNKNSEEEILKYFKRKARPNFLTDYKNKQGTVKVFKKEFSERVENVLRNADEICEHTFDLLGSGKVNLGKKINWHCDFKSGYCWNPKTFYLDIKYGDKKGVDVKVPWELSRFQHLATLGEAYWFTGDKKYTKEFINEIDDWIENNPPQYGVNWKCTMALKNQKKSRMNF